MCNCILSSNSLMAFIEEKQKKKIILRIPFVICTDIAEDDHLLL